MTVARRLIPVIGGGAFTSTTATAVSLGANGFWNVMAGPQAAYYNGKTYLAWCDSSRNIYAAQYVHSTATLSTPVLLASGVTAVDGAIHLAPAVLVRSSDHKIVVGYAPNGSGAAKVFISTNAEDATAFGAGITVTTATLTYCDLVELSGTIYFITGRWSGPTRDMIWHTSADGGATWSAATTVMHPGVNSTFFWHLVGNGSRIDMYTTDTDRTTAPSSVHHAYWDGSTLRNSAGTSLGSLAAFSNDGTLVSSASLGAAYVESATTDGGAPAAILFADTGTSTIQRRAVWNGASWDVDTIVDQGGYIGSNANIAGGAIAAGDKDTAYLPVKTGSHFEMFKYTYSGSWSGTQLTSGSPSENANPTTPQDAASGLVVLWGLGTYTDDFTFSFALTGLP